MIINVRKLFYILILFWCFPLLGQTQNVINTFVDRCTGETKVVTAAFVNGSATVAFYNRVRTFTWAEYTNGTLKAWLNETYAWWANLSPCSTNTANNQSTQQTTSNATSNATNAASNATSNATNNTGTTNTGSTNTNTNGNTGSTGSGSSSGNTGSSSGSSNSGNSGGDSSNSGSSGSDSGGSSGSSNNSGGDSGNSSGSDSGGDSGGDNSSDSGNSGGDDTSGDNSSDNDNGSSDNDNSSGDGDGSDDNSSGEEGGDSGGEGEEGGEDSSSEENKDENSEESSEESSEEESSEEEVEEESSEEESEESEEESSEEEESEEEESEEESEEEEEEESEEEDSEEEEEKEEKKKRNPINVSANLLTQQALDGTFSQAASFGLSQSSLTGATTYSANVMIWDNMEQFSLGLSQSDVYFNYDREEKLYLYNPITDKEDLYFGSIYHKGSIDFIQSISANFMYIYGTKVLSGGLSNVYMGQKDNFWKGFVGGYAISGTIINIDNTVMIMPSGVLFGTKPFPTKKVTISPMLALASNPVSYNFDIRQPGKGEIVWNKHITYIVGSNFDVNLTQRFTFNIGGNVIGTTLPGIPLTWSATIGSKFQF